ncbi:transposable element Tc3 transposase [Trichonephila clavipes]|nr:transposable element Tc3 transposase [Trichonephila clavipes]
MINGRTRLHVVANGTMTGQRYIDEVLLPHVRLFRGAVGDKFVFMDDNATCHRTLAVQDCLDREGIQRLVWPARSPDLNPIETVHEAHFWLNGYVNKQNCRIWSQANPQVYNETPLHPEKLTVWCALWAGGILLQKR